ncbi:DUF3099 domain-containing protein [Rhodococcus sp. CSLK01-03]|uniref:DUF3099 domain-containing protein n=1 Tax=Rhodococcus indonesiensis TaxID=3055869 RepID=A0ABT7RUP7_9NOCA|nr:DUF3099 domain-containing protein [Rhodococcus indonesiensis]MDM7491377.1 DUF3099 domain-containing protein [Rhodococcus indonesiensis]
MSRTPGFHGDYDDGSPEKPVLITEAASSLEEQHRTRVRKYLTLMSFRIPAMILAALAYAAFANPWLSVGILALSVPLPWVAVLIANDRPPRSKDEPSRWDGRADDTTALEGPQPRIIEG